MMDIRAIVPPLPATPIPRGKFTVSGLSVVNVSEPAVTANSIILYSPVQISGTLGVAGITGITPGVGFSVVSVVLNTSTYGYAVWEP